MHFFDRTLYLQICIWKQTFSLGKDERYRLTFDWRFSALSQSEIRVHWWTRNSKNPTNLGRREFNSTLHQSSHGLATRVHGFATKTKALAHEIPPTRLFTNPLTASPLAFTASLPKQKHSRTKSRQLDSSPILSRPRHSRSRLRYQNKSTRARNPASYAGYAIQYNAMQYNTMQCNAIQ